MSEEDPQECLSALATRIRPNPLGPNAIGLNQGHHFTGGEPFLNFDLLLRGVEVDGELGLPALFVETNCFWCREDDDTRRELELLKGAGLDIHRHLFERLDLAELSPREFSRQLPART
jgi:hypothetical protein